MTANSPKILAFMIAPIIAPDAAINDCKVVYGAISLPSNCKTDIYRQVIYCELIGR